MFARVDHTLFVVWIQYRKIVLLGIIHASRISRGDAGSDDPLCKYVLNLFYVSQDDNHGEGCSGSVGSFRLEKGSYLWPLDG